MPTGHWKYEMQAMGIDFSSSVSPIDQLLPSASNLWHLYKDDSPPTLDISHLSLEESLCHIRIVFQRLHLIDRRLKKTQITRGIVKNVPKLHTSRLRIFNVFYCYNRVYAHLTGNSPSFIKSSRGNRRQG